MAKCSPCERLLLLREHPEFPVSGFRKEIRLRHRGIFPFRLLRRTRRPLFPESWRPFNLAPAMCGSPPFSSPRARDAAPAAGLLSGEARRPVRIPTTPEDVGSAESRWFARHLRDG